MRFFNGSRLIGTSINRYTDVNTSKYTGFVAYFEKWFFARMCLYLLALVNSWGTGK